jgi:hypothetical protein
MNVIFHNVHIGLAAKDAKAAYTKLCNILKDTEYSTDTYTIENSEIVEHNTRELFPEL